MSGALATVGLSAAASAGGAATTAALVLNALAGGLSEIGLIADRGFIAGTTACANRRRPFVIQGGALFADELNVNWANIVNVKIQWGQISSAVVNNFVAQNENIANASITGGKIAATVITSNANNSATISQQNVATWREITNVTIVSDSGRPLKVYALGLWNATASVDVEVQVRLNGNALPKRTFGGSGSGGVAINEMFMVPVASGQYTISLWGRRAFGSGATGFAGELIAECNECNRL